MKKSAPKRATPATHDKSSPPIEPKVDDVLAGTYLNDSNENNVGKDLDDFEARLDMNTNRSQPQRRQALKNIPPPATQATRQVAAVVNRPSHVAKTVTKHPITRSKNKELTEEDEEKQRDIDDVRKLPD